ncbi:UNVERIFIED_CONTAM: manganese/zinc/iron transport system substrate-binding protein [Acetivibrio alkalicellulosi]
MKYKVLSLVIVLVILSASYALYLYTSNITNNASLPSNNKLQVVTTTTMITDLLKVLGEDAIDVHGLMGPGIDPHSFQATEGDVIKLSNADIIFYNGLHLEGKMADLFEEMSKRNIPTYAVTDAIDKSKLLAGEDNYEGSYDPHIWLDVMLWKDVVVFVTDILVELDSSNAYVYSKNANNYIEELKILHEYVNTVALKVPEEHRVLITAHDAFQYFGIAYGFKVLGLQGLSTETQAGIADVRNLADFICQHKIPAIFIETSVQTRHIEALKEAVQSRNFNVEIGGELFSDSMGDLHEPEGTYIGMVKHNIDTITKALNP